MGMLASAFGATVPVARAPPTTPIRLAKTAHAMTIVYPAGDGIKFDADYYRDHHLKPS